MVLIPMVLDIKDLARGPLEDIERAENQGSTTGECLPDIDLNNRSQGCTRFCRRVPWQDLSPTPSVLGSEAGTALS